MMHNTRVLNINTSNEWKYRASDQLSQDCSIRFQYLIILNSMWFHLMAVDSHVSGFVWRVSSIEKCLVLIAIASAAAAAHIQYQMVQKLVSEVWKMFNAVRC